MKAMLLAAGEGTRLRPLTHHQPKVLLPIGGVPLLKLILSWLKSQGITQIAINLHHLGQRVKDYLGDGSPFGLQVFYSVEETILGTAGGVKKAGPFFADTFVVVYGDVLTDFDLKAMVDLHKAKKALATIAVTTVDNPWDVGIVTLAKGGRVSGFIEKPPRGNTVGNLANGGVYILEKAILDYIPPGFSDFGRDIFPKLIGLGLPLYGYPLKPGDYLIDIGTPQRYHQADEDVRQGKVKIPKPMKMAPREG